jgi:hypothetical protein
LAAIMFVRCASFPLERFEPSFNTRTGTPPPDPCDDKLYPSSSNASTTETASRYKFF